MYRYCLVYNVYVHYVKYAWQVIDIQDFIINEFETFFKYSIFQDSNITVWAVTRYILKKYIDSKVAMVMLVKGLMDNHHRSCLRYRSKCYQKLD